MISNKQKSQRRKYKKLQNRDYMEKDLKFFMLFRKIIKYQNNLQKFLLNY